MKKILAVLFLLGHFCLSHAGNFASGNLVVLRVGTGSSSLSSSATPVFIDEYTRAGVLVQSIAVPTSTSGSTHALTLSGTAISEGGLALSTNGQYLIFAGYDASPPTPSVASDSTLKRTIARVGTNGSINTSTGINAGVAYIANNIRSVTSIDGSSFWAAGDGDYDSGGTFYLPFGSFTSSPVKISSAPNNNRTINIFNNQLYISSNTNVFNGISTVGNGVPTTGGKTTTLLSGFVSPSSGSSFDFWFFDVNAGVSGVDVLYVCDDRDIPPNGGIYKYSLVGGTWVSNGNVSVAHAIKGLTAERTCYTQMYCVSGSRVYSLRDDNGYNQPITGSLTDLVVAASNTKFRGVAFAPGTILATALQASVSSSTNISCFGLNNGSINISVSGGKPSYSYNWGGGVTTQNRSNLSPGTYTLTVTDASGCTATANATITQPAQLSGSASGTNVSCNGGNNGSITLTVNGGTPSFTYNWGSGVTTQNRTNLSAGTYTVTITDSKSCTATASTTITQPSVLSGSTSSTNVSCFGGNNGSITLTVSGGTPGYTYNWGGGVTTQNRSNLTAATYTVTITDSKGCTATSSKTITQPTVLSTSTTKTDAGCGGGNSGSIDLTVSGGTSPYTYSWSNGTTTQDLSNLAAGTYTVTLNDNKGCTATDNETISQSVSLSTSFTKVDVSCNGGNNGSIDLTVSGGASPYLYNWSNGRTTQDITSLSAGTFNVTVSDVNGCSVTTGATITQPASLNATLTKVNVSCNGGNDGSIDLTVSGGTSPYTYSWTNAATTQDLNNLQAGTFNVTVTDSKGCTATAGSTITQPTALSVTTIKTDVSCNGGSNGSITLTVSGGTSSYTYVWSNGATTQNISGLSTGTFNVTVTDSKGCTATSGKTINQPSALSASITKVDVTCGGGNNGSIDLSVSGGTSPYSYGWSNGATSQDVSMLIAGTFSVTVTDSKGCTVSKSTTISEPTVLSAGVVKTDVSCNGANNGSLDLTVTGGTTAYSYSWSNGATTQDLVNLGSGTFTVTVTDAHACTATANATIIQPAILSATLTKVDVSCNGGNNGSITLSVSGGTTAYSYNWGSGVTTQNRSNLSIGTYNVTVTDSKGCTATSGTTITQPAVLFVSDAHTNVSCNGGNNGSITISVSGGTPSYSYNWSGGVTTQNRSNLSAGTYTVTVTDSKGCTVTDIETITQPSALIANTTKVDVSCNGGNNGSIDLTVAGGTSPYTYSWTNGVTTQNLNAIVAATYTVTVTDSKGCTAIKSTTVSQPAILSASVIKVDVSCNSGSNGSIDLTISGGTSPYTYGWSNGATTQDINNLSSGTFNVTINDANSCSATSATTITQPTTLSSSLTKINVSCNGGNNGSIDLTVSGGTTPYIYNWSSGQTTQDLNGLIAGTFNVTITDNKSCTATNGATITQPAVLSASNTKTNVSCNGGSNGALDLTVSGGTTPYIYAWTNGATTEDINSLAAGTFTVTVTDANSCSATSSATITVPSALSLSSTKINVSCNGGTNGSIDLTVSGGTTPYIYAWSNGATTQDLNSLAAATFTVTISDANNCTANNNQTISEPSAISISSSTTNASCNGGINGAITLTVSGGTPTYIYIWHNGATTKDLNNISAGLYNVTVTDNNSCAKTAGVTVGEASALTINLIAKNDLTCNDGNNGAIDISASGGLLPYTFSWSNGATTEDLIALAAGNFIVTVADANLCSKVESYTVNPAPVVIASITKTDVSCNGGNNGSAQASANGGTSPYSYNWSNTDTTQAINNLIIGNYTVTATDAQGCSATKTTTIIQPALFTASSTKIDVNCNGGNNGSIDLTVSGGTAPYSYSWSNNATTQDISNLVAATYSVTVTDNKSCTVVSGATISQPIAIATGVVKVDVSCNGGNNGSIDLTVSGGTPNYFYTWSNGATVQDIGSLSSGTYTVTISDANSCSTFETATITQPATLSASLTKVDINCYGENNGSIDITVTGGTTPYMYVWTNGPTTQDINGLTAGFFNVTVTDAKSCSTTTGTNITQPALLAVSVTKTDVNCNGGSDGQITLTVSGGTLPYNYGWSNGDTNKDITALVENTYTVTITDGNFCNSTSTTVINEPAILAATLSKIDVKCNGGSTGSIDLTVTGGKIPYSYNWSNGRTTQDVSAISAGTYTVTISDANNCSLTKSSAVNEPSVLAVSSAQTNVTCNGGNNGSINLTVTGGTIAYSFNWSGGETSQNISNLIAGNYEVTITDANSCSETSAATITQPLALTTSFLNQNVDCNGGNDGTIDLTVSGGTVPYSYNWSTAETTQDIENLSAGLYAVTITDFKGCIKISSTNISQSGTLSASVTKTDVSCHGGSDGQINLTLSGGNAPFIFIWSNGVTTKDLNGLVASNYTVNITDSNGCILTEDILINEPSILTVSKTITNAGCFGFSNGTVNLTTSGGTAPYGFIWTNGATTKDISSLPAGIFQVTVTDFKACATINSSTVIAPDELIILLTQSNVSCNGGNNGSINLTVNGGTLPYDFDWLHGDTTQNISGLNSGAYEVTVIDNKGCSANKSTIITEPDALAISASQVDVNCFGGNDGSITLTTTGGTTPYSFSWSNGGSGNIISGLMSGTFSVTATDIKGCTITEGINISRPSAIAITANVINLPCSGGNTGEIDITVSGGVSGYSYSWNNGATTEDISNLTQGGYSITVTDENGCANNFSATINQSGTLQIIANRTSVSCHGGNNGTINIAVNGGTPSYTFNWSNGDSAQNLSGIVAGNYILTVNDASGCSIISSSTITEPVQISVVKDITDITCFGTANGTIDLTIDGGILPYVFSWSNGLTTKNLSGLAKGDYSITVTDNNSCTITSDANISEPDLISITGNVSAVTSFGGNNGKITLGISGGTPNYSYAWNNSSDSKDISGLTVGDYCVTVTDENLCSSNKCFTVSQPTSINEKEILQSFYAYLSNDYLVIKAQLRNETNCRFQIFDLTGRLILAKEEGKISELNLRIPVSEISSSCYFVNIVTDNASISKKVVSVY